MSEEVCSVSPIGATQVQTRQVRGGVSWRNMETGVRITSALGGIKILRGVVDAKLQPPLSCILFAVIMCLVKELSGARRKDKDGGKGHAGKD